MIFDHDVNHHVQCMLLWIDFPLKRWVPLGILDFFSLAASLSFTYSEPCCLTVTYVIKYVTSSTQPL